MTFYCKNCDKHQDTCKCDARYLKDYLRVTEVLSPFSGLHDICQFILDKACERGTDVHNALDAHIFHGLPAKVSNPDWEPYIASAMAFLDGKMFIPKPKRFYDDELLLTGECDGIYKDGNDLVLIDFKTSSRESKTWRCQGSAYAYLARKYGYEIKRIEFIHLKKNGKPAKVYTYEEDFPFFMKCLDVYRYFFDSKKKDELFVE
jgi:hypothetical protein